MLKYIVVVFLLTGCFSKEPVTVIQASSSSSISSSSSSQSSSVKVSSKSSSSASSKSGPTPFKTYGESRIIKGCLELRKEIEEYNKKHKTDKQAIC